MVAIRTAVLLIDAVQTIDDAVTRVVLVQASRHVITLAQEVVGRTRDVLTRISNAVEATALTDAEEMRIVKIVSLLH